MLADMLARHRTGLPLPDPSLTVGAYLRSWLAHAAPELRPGSAAKYTRYVDVICADMGTVPLVRLSPSRVEAMTARVSGVYARRGAHAVLVTALKAAVRDGIVERNAAAIARPPKVPVRQKPAPTVDDVRALVAALEGHRLRDMVIVLAATGLRVGEAMGLRWEDVDGATLTVRHQLRWDSGEPVLTPPKSERSIRTITLAPVAVEALRRQREAQARERFGAHRIGRGWDTGLVFTARDGGPLRESSVQYVMTEACKRAGIRHVSPHDMRRWASTVVAATGDMKAAQEMLGHTAATLTADLYASGTDTSRRRAADAIEEAMR